MEVRRAVARPVIDGKLNDAAWAKADAVTLQFPWDQPGAKQKTVARVLWDDDYLYIAYDCEDLDITAQYDQRDDPTYKDDAVEAFINPRPSQTTAYFGFEMNARSTVYDYITVPGLFLLKRWNPIGVQIATYVDGTLNARGDQDRRWSLEVAIPLAELEGLAQAKPKVGDVWSINLNRWDGVEPDRRLSVWSDSAQVRPNPHNAKRFGKMTFVN
jgi:hypothetical protein